MDKSIFEKQSRHNRHSIVHTRSKALIFTLITTICILVTAASWTQRTQAAAAESMIIYAIELGAENRGEATMVVDGTGGSLLIDTGIGKGDELFKWLNKQKYQKKKFNLLITHWHDDHIAYAERLIRSYRIGTIYIPGTEYADSHYKRIRDNIVSAAKARKTKVVTRDDKIAIDVHECCEGKSPVRKRISRK